MPQDKSGRETAESVFARIQRRRQAERARHADGQTGLPPEPPSGPDAADSLRDIREAIDRLKAEQAAAAGRSSRPHPSASTRTGSTGAQAHTFGQNTGKPHAYTWRQAGAKTSAEQADPAGPTRYHHSALHDAEFIDVDEDGNPLPPPDPRNPSGSARFQANPDGFPRSRTLRLLLKHPEIALLVAVPAASVMLRSAATRKALFRLGKLYGEREVWRAVDRLLDGGTSRR